MNDLAVWVCGWDENKALALVEQFKREGVPNVFWDVSKDASELAKHNRCIDESIRRGFKYILLTDNDVEWRHRETIPTMYRFISTTPTCGLIRPWIEGEPPRPGARPRKKYVEDGTGWMFRLGVARMDEEYIFCGYGDIDFGNEIEYQGYECYSDPSYPVYHDPAQSRNWSSFRQAYNKRNKLLLDTKWYKVGRANWRGVDAYNASVPPDEQIPNVYQLAGMTQEAHWVFAESISPEHHQIWVKDGRENPNLVWRNPLIVGYSTRERFEREHGYS